MGSADLKYKDAAEKFGVTPRQLRTFVRSKPSTMRSNLNRSPAYRKLYGTADTAPAQRKQVREQLGLSRIKRYEPRESEIQNIRKGIYPYPERERRNRQAIGELVQNLYVSRSHARYDWAEYAREHDLPTSIDTIKLLHRNNKLSDSEYMDAVSTWRDIYNVNSVRYANYSLSDYTDYEDDEGEVA